MADSFFTDCLDCTFPADSRFRQGPPETQSGKKHGQGNPQKDQIYPFLCGVPETAQLLI